MIKQLTFDFGPDRVSANEPFSYRTTNRQPRDFYGPSNEKRQWRLVMEHAKWRCQAGCGAVYGRFCKLQADHIIPTAAGGPDTLSNMQALCPRCHELKTSIDALRYGWRGKRSR